MFWSSFEQYLMYVKVKGKKKKKKTKKNMHTWKTFGAWTQTFVWIWSSQDSSVSPHETTGWTNKQTQQNILKLTLSERIWRHYGRAKNWPPELLLASLMMSLMYIISCDVNTHCGSCLFKDQWGQQLPHTCIGSALPQLAPPPSKNGKISHFCKFSGFSPQKCVLPLNIPPPPKKKKSGAQLVKTLTN